MNENTQVSQQDLQAKEAAYVKSFSDSIVNHYKAAEDKLDSYKDKLHLSERIAAGMIDNNVDYTYVRIISEFAADLQARCAEIMTFRAKHHSDEKTADTAHKSNVRTKLKAARENKPA